MAKAAKVEAPTGLSIKRNGYKFTVTWKIKGKDAKQALEYRVGYYAKATKKDVKKKKANKVGNRITKTTAWKAKKNLGAKVKKKKFSIKASSYYPNKSKQIDYIQVRVKRGNKVSETKTYQVSGPPQPSISVDVLTWPSCKFSWSVPRDNAKGDQWVTNVKVYTGFVKDSGSYFNGWGNPVHQYPKASSNGDPYTEESEDLTTDLRNGHAWTRWYKVESYGPGGMNSRTAYHVYCFPGQALITSQQVTTDEATHSYFCQLYFNFVFNNYNKPVKELKAKYAITKPSYNMSCPPNVSWTEALTIMPTAKNAQQGAPFRINRLLEKNECLFFIIESIYDGQTVVGVPKLAEGINYKLSEPEWVELEPTQEDYTFHIKVNNTANDVPDSVVVVRYFEEDKYSDGIDIGVIPHGKTEIILQTPEWSDPTKKHFGIYSAAIVGGIPSPVSGFLPTLDTEMQTGTIYYEKEDEDIFKIAVKNSYSHTSDTKIENYKLYYVYNEEEAEYELVDIDDYIDDEDEDEESVVVPDINPSVEGWFEAYEDLTANPSEEGWYVADNFMRYSIYPAMSSNIVLDGGNVPQAPGDVKASMTNTPGTIRVTWSWPWEAADSAELSWSDNKDAWESTSQPSTYTINKLKASAWNITGLEVAKEWYVRIRLIKGLEDPKTYSSYSAITEDSTIKLISAPQIPYLAVSDEKSTITKDDTTKIYWTYSTTDGTSQKMAEVAEILEGVSEPKTLFSLDGGVQNAVIDPSSTSLNWNSGEKHTLVVRVSSESGLPSADWSNPVTIVIADPITCDLESTSLVSLMEYGSEEIDPPAYSIITKNSESIEDFNLDEIVFMDSVYSSTSCYCKNYTFEFLSYHEGGVDLEGNTIYIPDEATVGLIDSYYSLTEDVAIDETKTYYLLTGTKVEEPINYDILEYYELSGTYSRTTDTEIDNTKDYYTVVAETVSAPVVEDISSYYELTTIERTSLTIDSDDFESYGIEDLDVDPVKFDEDLAEYGSVLYTLYFTKVYANELRSLPFSIKVANVQDDSEVSVTIVRLDSYDIETPDESNLNGYIGETIYTKTSSDPEFIIENQSSDGLFGKLDDGAMYTLNVSVTDSFGQVANAEPIDFTVNWDIQPSEPSATVEIDDENKIAILTPIAPESVNEGDVCDIYRLSVDKPTLIYRNATFGEKYVDPFPTIGEHGGHRFVTKSIYNDYITSDNEYAWYDTTVEDGDILNNHGNLINFGDETVEVLYEVDSISNSWSKDFQETKYLGGSIQGDWNKTISRTTSFNGLAVSDMDQDMIKAMRRLADYPGICHIRTKDGSSYSADVQVDESYEYTKGPRFNKYDLSITKVESEELDGLTYNEWLELNT